MIFCSIFFYTGFLYLQGKPIRILWEWNEKWSQCVQPNGISVLLNFCYKIVRTHKDVCEKDVALLLAAGTTARTYTDDLGSGCWWKIGVHSYEN